MCLGFPICQCASLQVSKYILRVQNKALQSVLAVVSISHSNGGDSTITFRDTLIQKAAIRLWAPDLTERRREVQELFFRVWGTSQPKLEAWRPSSKG